LVDKHEARADEVGLSKSRTAVLRIRLVPWLPRPRRLGPAQIRDNADGLLDLGDDLASLCISVGIWLTVIVGAPLLTFILAALLLPIEVGLLALIALVLLAVRFAGITHWTLVITEPGGEEIVEHYRNIARALSRVRKINGTRRRAVQLTWA
jgi:hypothetical protein